MTWEEAVKICKALDCQDCPISDYGNYDILNNEALDRLVCYEKLMEDYSIEDFKDIIK